MKSNNTISWRVSQLETNYEKMDNKLERLLTNDIPHIQRSISAMKTRINVLTTINVAAIITALILAKYF